MTTKTDTHNYDLTSQLERWSDDDLIKFALDTEVMMSMEKYQIVNIAQELAERYDSMWDTGVASEFND